MDTTDELLKGFYKLTREERLEKVQKICHLTQDEKNILSGELPVSCELAEHFIENVIGYFPLPLGVATYFQIDGNDLLIPMAVEETSIIAAVSSTAKWVKTSGTIKTHMKGNLIIGQIQFPFIEDVSRLKEIIKNNRSKIIQLANQFVLGLVNRGGGIRDLSVREIQRPDTNAKMVVLHVYCDPCEAMGANLINQVCEGLKPILEDMTGEKIGLCILSNLVDSKLAVAEVIIRNIDPKIGKGIVDAYQFAACDPYRAATHNKGVMNGIDPVLIVTGNDWRAVEAGVHAYAARSGQYKPVTEWKMEGPDLIGRFEAPLAVGTIGGVTRLHPFAKTALKMMKIDRSEELSRICAAVGLVQNLAALKALSTVGIVNGHMKLHAANLAYAAGAQIHEISHVRERLGEILKAEKKIDMTRAKEVLEELRSTMSNAIDGDSVVIN